MAEKNSLAQLSVPGAILLGSVIIAIGLIIAFGSGSGSNSGNIPANNSGGYVDNRPGIIEAAEMLDLDADAIEACVTDGTYNSFVEEDAANAVASGGTGTPYSVVIGPDGQTFPASGALPYEAWSAVVDSMLGIGEALPPTEGDQSQNVNPVTADDHILGSPDAPVKIVEYSDIDCPFCQRLHPTLEQIVNDRPDDVAWVYRHFPLTSLHPQAAAKAAATECVAEMYDDETFWEYLGLLVG